MSKIFSNAALNNRRRKKETDSIRQRRDSERPPQSIKRQHLINAGRNQVVERERESGISLTRP